MMLIFHKKFLKKTFFLTMETFEKKLNLKKNMTFKNDILKKMKRFRKMTIVFLKLQYWFSIKMLISEENLFFIRQT